MDLNETAGYVESNEDFAAQLAVLDDVPDYEPPECDGHESLNGADMGLTVYCDGSCAA